MSNQGQPIDFAFVMASSVHDMKNSLSLLLHSIDELAVLLPDIDANHPASHRISTLQYEASRVNNDLVQLLTLYKLENSVAGITLDEHDLDDFLLEQLARYEPLFQSRGVDCQIQCEEGLAAVFDRDLVSGIINNVLANAIRYCKQTIVVSARVPDAADDAGYGLLITIADDGTGFPGEMLDAADEFHLSSDFRSGSTHLGLYFADRIAKLHSGHSLTGKVRLSNGQVGASSSGAVFELLLP
ncbi:HAMP domain-containing sensor histidine kinase [Allohahella marinimesophila]|uniref:HAMP domain-containing sensor histidine kinase n=1 Tax=Allohahella marinimesophila TaxID=1054972 RepID=A0ABP7NQW4_9GAMM